MFSLPLLLIILGEKSKGNLSMNSSVIVLEERLVELGLAS